MTAKNLLNSFVTMTFGEYWEIVKDYDVLIITLLDGNSCLINKDHFVKVDEIAFFFYGDDNGNDPFIFPLDRQIKVFEDHVIVESFEDLLKLQFYKLTPIHLG